MELVGIEVEIWEPSEKPGYVRQVGNRYIIDVKNDIEALLRREGLFEYIVDFTIGEGIKGNEPVPKHHSKVIYVAGVKKDTVLINIEFIESYRVVNKPIYVIQATNLEKALEILGLLTEAVHR